jgi:hypothetical protein
MALAAAEATPHELGEWFVQDQSEWQFEWQTVLA